MTKNQKQKIDSLISEFEDRIKQIPWITVDDFLQRSERESWLILDGRSKEERCISKLPGAIAFEKLPRERNAFQNMNILVYCTIGYRSALLAKRLRSENLSAYNLRGGIFAWIFSNRTLVDEQGRPTKNVHVYGPKWNILPESYQAIW